MKRDSNEVWACGGFECEITAHASANDHAAPGETDAFLARAKAFGQQTGIADLEDAVIAFSRTPEGDREYQRYRSSLLSQPNY